MTRKIMKTPPNLARAFGLLTVATACFGYVQSVTYDASPTPLTRVDNTGIQFALNTSVVAGAQSSASGKTVTVISANSDPVAAVRNALATWNRVTTANIKFLSLKSTAAAIDPGDNQMTIAIGSSASDISAVSSALAVTVASYTLSAGVVNGVAVPKGAILDSDIIINPEYAFSTDGSAQNDLQSVITHELGHSLGANHSGLIGTSMFQFNSQQRFLTADEIAFAGAVYPLPNNPAPFGTISGTVTTQAGAPVPYALLTAFDTSAGVTVGGATAPDGTYSFQVPPGNYQIYAEPLTGSFAINIYLTQDQLNLANATKFQTTLFNGSLAVSAGSNAKANISVSGSASTLAAPLFAVTPVNSTSFSTAVRGGPVTLPSGQSVDLVLIGAGFDTTLNDSSFTFYGQGVALHAGSVRVDPNTVFNGTKALRVTLDVTARSVPELASFIVTSPAGTTSFSGALVVVPPTPTFTSKGVVSAGSFLGSPNGDGAVSPGGIYTIFDLPNTPNLGPNPYVTNGPYDAYGLLPTLLAGVSVTFDGVPAPMFLSFGGQLNLQAPFELAGKTSTKVVVNYYGSPSAAVTVPVLAVQPAIFTSCIDGKTLCAINLKDHTFNSATNPAAKGDYVEVYGTGAGKITAYSVLTGQGAPAPPGGYTGNYTYSIGGSGAAPALYGGWTPTSVGLAQWDLLIPASSASGAVPVSVTDASGATSQPGVTIYVK